MTASSPHSARDLFSYRKYWAKRYGIAPFLPMSRAEMATLGWDSCDIIIVTGAAYVDHPRFGMAVIAHRLAAGEAITDITDVRGTTFVRRGGLPDGGAEIDSADIDMPGRIDRPVDPYAMSSPSATACKTNRGAFGDDASGQGEGMGAHEAADDSSKSNDDVKVLRFQRRVPKLDREHSEILMPF